MKPAPFDYYAPETLEEALALLEKLEDDDIDAKILAGGQSLMPMLSLRMARPDALVDLGKITTLDYIREEAESELLNQAGLREEEDIFASVLDSVKNRWAWLAVNLVTAFVASRVIGVFEGSIEKLVALAALMPIVAGIGGNSGNQTITMIVRAMATGQVSGESGKRLLKKEMGVALINGVVWGGLLGALAWWLYGSAELGAVMTVATTLNLLLAASMGVVIPLTMQRFGRDPALGSSVLITACTDSGGFFIFLGLATLFLL